MKLIAGRARCRLSSSAALVDELQQFGGAGRTGEGLDFIALANRSIDRPRNYQPISALWGAWTRRPLGQARRCPSRLGPRETVSGGGGNRTRVLRRFDRTSPGAVCVVSARPHRSCTRAGV